MHQILRDVRFGARTLRKAPGFTAVAVTVLALGIGANTAMFTIVNATLFKPLAGRADELVGLYSHDRTKPDSYRAFSYQNYADIRGSGVFDELMAHTFAMVGIPDGDRTRQVFVDVVSSNYFATLDVALMKGRPFSAEEERPGAHIPVAIVGASRADQFGRTIQVNSMEFTVVGVVPPGFTGTMALVAPDLWVPLGEYDLVVNDMFKNDGRGLTSRASPSLVVAGRLAPGVTPDAAAARLDTVSRQLEAAYPAENKNQLLTIRPLPRMSTSTSPGTDAGLGLAAAMLLGMSAIVLLIACLNIANMLLARGAARRKEIAIRLAVGGGRARIVGQLLTEGLLLAGAGAVGGLAMAFWGTGALAASFSSVLPLAVEFDARPDAAILAATTAFAVAATILFALGPALKISRGNLVTDLKELTPAGSRSGLGRRVTARNALVVGQVALSLMLLAAGGLFARGALNAATATPGFEYSQELLVGLDAGLVQYDESRGRDVYRRVLDRVRGLPGVAAAGVASSVPFGEFHEGHPVLRVGAAGGTSPVYSVYRIVGAEYFAALGLPMVRGREFTVTEEEGANAPRVAIVDERLARQLFGDADPIGQLIRFAEQPGAMHQLDREAMEIVGIAAPIRDELFSRAAGPAIYVPTGRNYRGGLSMHVRAARPGADGDLLAAIRREVRAADAAVPLVQATTMRAFHEGGIELWAVRTGGRLFMTFGLIALVLAVIGLYGVKSYLVAQRTREIGIRMALGARPVDVLRMVLGDGALLAGVGVAIGLPLAAALGLLLGSALYDVHPLDPVVFTAAPALLAVAALVATWIPARRATKIVPLDALRE